MGGEGELGHTVSTPCMPARSRSWYCHTGRRGSKVCADRARILHLRARCRQVFWRGQCVTDVRPSLGSQTCPPDATWCQMTSCHRHWSCCWTGDSDRAVGQTDRNGETSCLGCCRWKIVVDHVQLARYSDTRYSGAVTYRLRRSASRCEGVGCG